MVRDDDMVLEVSSYSSVLCKWVAETILERLV